MLYTLEMCEFPDDVARIMKIAADHGVDVQPIEAEKAWRERSTQMGAGWLVLPTDDAIWESLPEWFTGPKS